MAYTSEPASNVKVILVSKADFQLSSRMVHRFATWLDIPRRWARQCQQTFSNALIDVLPSLFHSHAFQKRVKVAQKTQGTFLGRRVWLRGCMSGFGQSRRGTGHVRGEEDICPYTQNLPILYKPPCQCEWCKASDGGALNLRNASLTCLTMRWDWTLCPAY